MRFLFLGTGTSVGVPQIGCDCKVCTSLDPRDKRRRCGAYVQANDGTAFLIDTPPEMRLACLEYGISKVDAILLTHAHMDHVAGFDDIRRFNTINGERVSCDPSSPGANGRTFRIIGKPLPCYGMKETIAQMHVIFPYISAKGGEKGLFRPQVEFVANDTPFAVGSVKATALKVEHGFPCCGYLLEEDGKRLVYISDCHELPEETLALAAGADVLVLNCLREREHPTHLSLSRALAYTERIAPGKAYFIHMCHDLSHEELLSRTAGSAAKPAYDGLEVTT
ncbi:MAG: MBL fold metallo-hydrolase [Kiritimatiellae bacterium]|nr:MBL fold metallo-hydrolase [Kiritimatiellia bacterium]